MDKIKLFLILSFWYTCFAKNHYIKYVKHGDRVILQVSPLVENEDKVKFRTLNGRLECDIYVHRAENGIYFKKCPFPKPNLTVNDALNTLTIYNFNVTSHTGYWFTREASYKLNGYKLPEKQKNHITSESLGTEIKIQCEIRNFYPSICQSEDLELCSKMRTDNRLVWVELTPNPWGVKILKDGVMWEVWKNTNTSLFMATLYTYVKYEELSKNRIQYYCGYSNYGGFEDLLDVYPPVEGIENTLPAADEPLENFALGTVKATSHATIFLIALSFMLQHMIC